MPALQICGPDGSGQAIFCVIRFGNSFFFGIERRDVTHGPENLFPRAARRFEKASEDGWLNVEAIITTVAKFWYAPAGDNGSAFFSSEFEI